MKNKVVKIGIVASILPHVFCCGMPIALSLVGLFAPETTHIEIIPHWMEVWIFVVSGLLLALSWVLVMRDCGCGCDACHGRRSHRMQKIILAVITVLFVLSLFLHLFLH